MISPSEEIKSRLDVADIVGSYIKLHQAGANLKGLCPFHHEKTPSFYVSKEKQIWHCFGCSLGGDIFSFVMKMDGVEFPDALRMLADRAGVPLRSEDPRVRSERTRMYDMVKAAAAFYQEILAAAEQNDIRQYLAERALTQDTIGKFRIGYAPRAGDALFRHLKFRGFRPEEIERSGLLVRNERGEFYDRFRNRIMFPLSDIQGNVVGFSGRHFEPRHPPASTMTPAKYVNTPETLLYSKGKLLYGLHAARDAIRKKNHAVLVEGQFDLVLSHQAGIEQAIATSGTALTEDHVRILKRHTSVVHTAFDSDAAGDLATKRSVMLLARHDISVKVISLAEGKDPADLVREDAALWQRAVDDATPLIDFYMDKAVTHADTATAEGKRAVADELLPLIRALASPVLRGHYLAELAALVGIDEKFLHEALKKIPEVPQEESHAPQPAPKEVTRNRWTEIEEYLVAFLLKHPGMVVKFKEQLSPELFSAPHTCALFPHIFQSVQNNSADTNNLAEILPRDLRDSMSQLLLKTERYLESLENPDPEYEIRVFIRELAMRGLRVRLRQLGVELKQSRADLRQKILEEFSHVSAELQRHEKHDTIAAAH